MYERYSWLLGEACRELFFGENPLVWQARIYSESTTLLRNAMYNQVLLFSIPSVGFVIDLNLLISSKYLEDAQMCVMGVERTMKFWLERASLTNRNKRNIIKIEVIGYTPITGLEL